MASQDVNTKSDEADLRSATPQETQAKFQEAGLPDSRPPTVNTIVNHDEEEKGIDSPKVPFDGGVFTIPDGGLRAWSVAFGSFLIIFSTFGYVSAIMLSNWLPLNSRCQVNAFGVYQSYYSQHLGKTESVISWIGSFQLWMQFALGAPAGKLFDEGYCRHLIAGGSLIYVFSLFMVRTGLSQRT